MTLTLIILASLMVGGTAGFLLCACMTVAKWSDEEAERLAP
jgi:hypothetical protein